MPSFIEKVLYLMSNLVVFKLLQLQVNDLARTSFHTCVRKPVGDIPTSGGAGKWELHMWSIIWPLLSVILPLEPFFLSILLLLLLEHLSSHFTLSSKLRTSTTSSGCSWVTHGFVYRHRCGFCCECHGTTWLTPCLFENVVLLQTSVINHDILFPFSGPLTHHRTPGGIRRPSGPPPPPLTL